MQKEAKKDKIGICLSGGGALGFAHIGALQALNDSGIFPDEVSGTSMGAIVGSLYAAGYQPQEIFDMISSEKMNSTFNLLHLIKKPARRKSGLSTHKPLLNILKKYIPKDTFESLKLPCYVCVTNLSTGEYEIISEGDNVRLWVAASASIPEVFELANLNGSFYCDGGLLNNFPAQPLTAHCKNIIGFNVSPYVPITEVNSLISSFMMSIRVTLNHNSHPGKALCTHYMESNAIEVYNEFSFSSYKEIFTLGYQEVICYLALHPELKK